MNPDTKIIFFDIDGTLITEDGRRYFPESAKQAIREARANGHLVFINTGRVFCNVNEEIREAGFDGYVCGCGTYISYNGETLFHHETDRQVCHKIAAACRKYRMYPLYEHTDRIYIDGACEKNQYLREIVTYFRGNGNRVYDNIETEDFVFDKFCAWYDAGNPDLAAFKQETGQDFTYIQREGNFCEMSPVGYSKATGIRFLLEYFRLPLENAYAFGDSTNDEAMLSYVKNSIIMQKGPESMKKKVMMVTEDAEDHGIYNALKKLEII